MIEKALIVANGKPPLKSHLKKLKQLGWKYLIAADGGYNHLLKLQIEPTVVIGDFDSIKIGGEKSRNAKFIRLKRQNDTDVEKAVKYAISKKISRVILLASTGKRLDHTIGNLSIPLKFKDEIEISILTNYSFMQIVKGEEEFVSKKGETVSFIAFDRNVSFTSFGLKYKMEKLKLAIGYRESISNESSADKFKIIVRGGSGYMIRDVNFVLKNELL